MPAGARPNNEIRRGGDFDQVVKGVIALRRGITLKTASKLCDDRGEHPQVGGLCGHLRRPDPAVSNEHIFLHIRFELMLHGLDEVDPKRPLRIFNAL
jgi:hypothetical protein